MSKLIYNKTKSHGNTATPASGAGVDTIKITVPGGQKFSHFTISQATGHSGAGTFTVVKAPKANATGNIEIKVMWTNGPFSKCSYKLKVYSKITDTVTKPVVVFGDGNWYNLSIGYIKQRKAFIIKVRGADALKVFNVLNPIRRNLIDRNIMVNEATTVAITIAVCITIVAVSGLAVLGAVLLYSINQGCTADAEYDLDSVLTGPLNQELSISVMGCSGS